MDMTTANDTIETTEKSTKPKRNLNTMKLTKLEGYNKAAEAYVTLEKLKNIVLGDNVTVNLVHTTETTDENGNVVLVKEVIQLPDSLDKNFSKKTKSFYRSNRKHLINFFKKEMTKYSKTLAKIK